MTETKASYDCDARRVIFRAINDEREFQDAKWGPSTERGLPLTVWLTVLTEEVGEAAQDILKHRRDNLYVELTQVAAVAVAMLECLDNAPWGVNDTVKEAPHDHV